MNRFVLRLEYNDLGYYKDNCKRSNRTEQQNNISTPKSESKVLSPIVERAKKYVTDYTKNLYV